MLLRFSVANYGSFNERQELSLVASTLKDGEEGLGSWPDVPNPERLPQFLPSAVIFGPNAAGKSKFVDAVLFLRSQVLHSHSRGDIETPIPRNPFRLAPGNQQEPSVFTIEFLVGGVLHEFGCALTESEVKEEWLHRFPTQRRQMLFEREGREFEFGRSLRGFNRRIAAFTRPNSLFLSAAIQNNHPQLSSVGRFFAGITGENTLSPDATAISMAFDAPERVDKRTLRFLKQIDTGVVSIHSQTQRLSERQLDLQRKVLPLLFSNSDVALSQIPDLFGEEETHVVLEHEGEDGFRAKFEIDEESAGTRRLLFLLPQLLHALDTGSLFILDELDVSVHTLVCALILDLFRSTESNTRGAQLITTTHNTELLKMDHLRRDQIWFVEKNSQGASQLFSLAEMKIRKDDNWKKGYLEGRFGAIPFARKAVDLWPFPLQEEDHDK